MAVQAVLAFLALALVCRVAREMTGSCEIAALATLLTFLMGHFGELAGLVIPYAVVPALALTFCALLFTAHRRRSILAAAISGLILGGLGRIQTRRAALEVWDRCRRHADRRRVPRGRALGGAQL
jgi:4-amino-4-deoxy-L-arabinose transferase-like glycosyltransferase